MTQINVVPASARSPAQSNPDYRARLASSSADVRAAQVMRFEVFDRELDEGLVQSYESGLDADPFDAVCDHLIVEDQLRGSVIGTYRLQTGHREAEALGYYSEREFDFGPFQARPPVNGCARALLHQLDAPARCPASLARWAGRPTRRRASRACSRPIWHWARRSPVRRPSTGTTAPSISQLGRYRIARHRGDAASRTLLALSLRQLCSCYAARTIDDDSDIVAGSARFLREHHRAVNRRVSGAFERAVDRESGALCCGLSDMPAAEPLPAVDFEQARWLAP